MNIQGENQTLPPSNTPLNYGRKMPALRKLPVISLSRAIPRAKKNGRNDVWKCLIPIICQLFWRPKRLFADKHYNQSSNALRKWPNNRHWLDANTIKKSALLSQRLSTFLESNRRLSFFERADAEKRGFCCRNESISIYKLLTFTHFARVA